MRPQDLTEHRLGVLAGAIEEARRLARERLRLDLGETLWTLGVSAHEILRAFLVRLEGEHGWLTLTQTGNQQIEIRVGEVPLRVWRGDHDAPNARILRPGPVEQFQRRFFFDDEAAHVEAQIAGKDWTGFCWRIVYETNANGQPSGIRLVQFNGDMVVDLWEIDPTPVGAPSALPAHVVPDFDVPLVKGEIDGEQRVSG